MNWLDGKWISKVQGNDVTESWKRTNDSTWTGQSEFTKDGELLFSEEMTISKHNNVFSFTSSSDDQNEGKSVQFIATEVSKEKVVFENKEHTYPQQIVYEKNHKDSMLAYISGKFNGQEQRINFRMSRRK
jgi:antitoxin component YwqK of YwqJK toxin-antitoxin module|tara:strand:+ start:10810 stop:11199 length:390 start_codon:yes stop_codon:yes gene_type:complete